MTAEKEINQSKSDIIRKLIYHSLEINACKKLKLKLKSLEEPIKLVLNRESKNEISKLNSISININAKLIKHRQVAHHLAKTLLNLNDLETVFKPEEIVPFGTSDIEKGFVEIVSNINDNVYYILLNMDDKRNSHIMYLTNSYSELPKGYKLLFN